MTTQDLHDLKQLFEFAILTGDKPELTKSDCEMVVAAVEELMRVRRERDAEQARKDELRSAEEERRRLWTQYEGLLRKLDERVTEYMLALPEPRKVSV